jgi:hypothetical protein
MTRRSRTLWKALTAKNSVQFRPAQLTVEQLEARCLLNSSPIQHLIYVVKENRTFDQVFGSLGQGNGDPSLNLFGEESAPNQRALQRTFLTLVTVELDPPLNPHAGRATGDHRAVARSGERIARRRPGISTAASRGRRSGWTTARRPNCSSKNSPTAWSWTGFGWRILACCITATPSFLPTLSRFYFNADLSFDRVEIG